MRVLGGVGPGVRREDIRDVAVLVAAGVLWALIAAQTMVVAVGLCLLVIVPGYLTLRLIHVEELRSRFVGFSAVGALGLAQGALLPLVLHFMSVPITRLAVWLGLSVEVLILVVLLRRRRPYGWKCWPSTSARRGLHAAAMGVTFLLPLVMVLGVVALSLPSAVPIPAGPDFFLSDPRGQTDSLTTGARPGDVAEVGVTVRQPDGPAAFVIRVTVNGQVQSPQRVAAPLATTKLLIPVPIPTGNCEVRVSLKLVLAGDNPGSRTLTAYRPGTGRNCPES